MKKQILILLSLAIIFFSCANSNEESIIKEITINSYNPKEGCIGDTITIIGESFHSNSKITLSDINSDIIKLTSNEIKSIIPEGVNKGNNLIKLASNNDIIEIGYFNAIIDDYKYLIYDNWSSTLFEVGNNTGKVNEYSKLNNINSNNISLYGFSKNKSKLYLIEFSTTSTHNTLVTFDVNSKQTSTISLSLPNGINGGITSLKWNPTNNKLIGIVSENVVTTDQAKHHLIEIDPISGVITNKNLSFNHSFISSIIIKNNKLFIFSTTSPYELSKINLDNLLIEKLSTNDVSFALTRTTLNSSEEIIGIQTKEGSDSVGELVKFNEINSSVEKITSDKILHLKSKYGAGYYDYETNEYIDIYPNFDINSTSNQPIYQSLFKFDLNSFKENKLLFKPKRSFTTPTIIGIIEL